jgi:hypothetical protein
LPWQGIPSEAVTDQTVARLVGEVFEVAPLTERRRLLNQLLPVMGVLSLVAVANGIFARIRFRSDWVSTHVRAEDAAQVRASDVADLVERLQLMRVDAVDGLAHWVVSSPVLASSAAALVLVTVLMQRARTRPLPVERDGA